MTRTYSHLFLKSILPSVSTERVFPALWRCLLDNGISKFQPTRRGNRAGKRKLGIMVSNVMSLAPKTCEVSEFVLRNKVSLAFITETWLKSFVSDSVIDIPGYSVLRRDRSSNGHGGTCLYLKDASYKRLDELSCCQEHEVSWVKLRPKRLPRGFSSLIAGVVYHPHWTDTENYCMRDHLFQSLLLAVSLSELRSDGIWRF